MECAVCNVSGEKVKLFDAIGNEGIIKICQNCSFNEHIPLIRKPTTFQLKEEENPRPFSQRKKEFERKTLVQRSTEKQDITLRDIVDQNYKKRFEAKPLKPSSDLVDNFHWIIMRARRKRHMTTKQLAEEIAESEIAIKMAEQGKLPEDEYVLVRKLENFLGIILSKSGKSQVRIEMEKPKRIFDFDSESVKTLTIEDLREMKKRREEEERLKIQEKEEMEDEEEIEMNVEGSRRFKESEDIPVDVIEREIEKAGKKEDKPSFKGKKDLTQAEIDKLIFGR